MTPEVSQEGQNIELEPAAPDAVAPQATETAAEPTNQNPWKTAFIILTGIVLLSGVMIYSTSVKRTDPATVLLPDANGQPVQPMNPASGVEEERLASMPPDSAVAASNSNSAVQPNQLPGGDGYNAWANGGAPPPGAPKIGPGGQYVTVPNGGSQFMPPDCIPQPSGIFLCPVPTNANAAVKPTPKSTPQNANVQPSPTPGAGVVPKATPTPPAPARPTPTPRTRSTPAKPATSKTPEEN